jgi:hypothetical protein
MYYRAVSVMCLLQSVYVAMWATDISSIALHTEHYIIWELAIAFPIILNFFLLHHTIIVSGVIRAMTHRNAEILDEIVEEAREQKNVAQHLRIAIVDQLMHLDIPEGDWHQYVYDSFVEADADDSNEIDEEEFLQWFRYLDLHFTRRTTIRMFRALDRDKSGAVSWKEIQAIIFPDWQMGRANSSPLQAQMMADASQGDATARVEMEFPQRHRSTSSSRDSREGAGSRSSSGEGGSRPNSASVLRLWSGVSDLSDPDTFVMRKMSDTSISYNNSGAPAAAAPFSPTMEGTTTSTSANAAPEPPSPSSSHTSLTLEIPSINCDSRSVNRKK